MSDAPTLSDAGRIIRPAAAAEAAAEAGECYEAPAAPLTPAAAEAAAEAVAADQAGRASVFDALVRNRAGEVITHAARAKAQEARETLTAQSLALASALAHAGTDPYLPASAPRLAIVDPDPEHESALPQPRVRRWNFFPIQAASRRATMVKDLEDHIARHPETRMVTLTAGPRIVAATSEAGAIREAISAFHRRISNLASATRPDCLTAFCRMFGFVWDYRATEFGTVYPLPDGRLSAHLHAHCFARFTWRAQVWPRREWICLIPRRPDARNGAIPAVRFGGAPIPYGRRWRALLRLRRIHAADTRRTFGARPPVRRGERWRLYLDLARRARAASARQECFTRLFGVVWGAHWDMGHAIDKAREACKYPIKPADLERLNPSQIAYLRRETSGMRLVTALGELKAVRRQRRADAVKGAKWRESAESPALALRFGPDYNAFGPRDLDAIARKARDRLAFRVAGLARFLLAAEMLAAADAIDDAHRLPGMLAGRRLTVAGLAGLAAALIRSGLRRLAALPCAVLAAVRLAGRIRRDARRAFPRDPAALAGLAGFGAVESAPARRAAFLLAAIVPATAAECALNVDRAARARARTGANAAPVVRLDEKLGVLVEVEGAPAGGAPQLNKIVARLAPAPYFDRVTRPALLVRGFTGDFAALRNHPFVVRMLAAAGPAVREAEACIRAEAEADAADAFAALAGERPAAPALC